MTRRSSRRRICVVTGTRAEYGVLRSVMRAIVRHPRLELQLLVTGMHLLRKFGHTVDGIRADGWRIDAQVQMQRGHDDAIGEAEATGRGVQGIARALRRLRSDVVLVTGDRVEAFAGAVAGACARLFVAHVHGGDRALGDVDDSLRHAITKLAHIHLVATEDAARRVRRLGEESSRIFCVGAPGLDEMRAIRRPSADWLRHTLGWHLACDYALIVQHPWGRTAEAERRDMRATLSAVAAAGLAGVILYPNSDPGHSGIIEAIKERVPASGFPGTGGRAARRTPGDVPWAAEPGRWFVAKSLDRSTFIRLLKGARVMVGNSSAGIIESATAGVPAVNIGPRQQGRLKGGPSVIDCRPGREAVLRAIQRAIRLHVSSDNSPYGDGHAGRRIAAALARIRLDEAFHRKLITF
jgi:GDP/UDP-N,N'-diacetylbacillosamine 2-epimerase (hydrolysing)